MSKYTTSFYPGGSRFPPQNRGRDFTASSHYPAQLRLSAPGTRGFGHEHRTHLLSQHCQGSGFANNRYHAALDSIHPLPVASTGLRNFGNTCFMNSVLQCLVHTAELCRQFSDGRALLAGVNADSRLKGCLIRAFRSFLSTYAQAPVRSALAPYDIKHYIEQLAPQFRGCSQHDAAEFMRVLLDGLHQELNRVRGKPVYREMSGSVACGISKTATDWWTYALERDNSPVTDVFQGQLLSVITCRACSEQTLSCDTFLDLTLPLPTRSSNVSLLDCFGAYVQETPLPGYHCEKCKRSNCCSQSVTFYRFPKVLVIQLKRFSVSGYRRAKLNTSVQLPESMILAPYAPLSTDSTVSKASYKLFGVVHHIGTLGFGHYIADAVVGNQWKCFDDSKVSGSRPPRYSDTAYVLFYSRDN